MIHLKRKYAKITIICYKFEIMMLLLCYQKIFVIELYTQKKN